MRRCVLTAGLAWLLATMAAANPLSHDASPNHDSTAVGDASLADVCFVDRTTGWAVGERGVIWHTHDGGASWQLQNSGVGCRLNSVCFIDRERGWAVGGAAHPHSGATVGAVIRTVDGGQTWTNLPQLVLPRLARVQFFSTNDGVAFGEGSSLNPSGVFITRDGGRSWQSLPADQSSDWLAGDFLDVDTGAVAGAGGRFATLLRRQVTHSPLASDSPRRFHAMRLAAPTGGWLVGDGGVVMTTGDLGRSWQSPSAELPSDVFGQFDFHAVAVRGPNVWIAGSPGTRVFYSPDGGNNWLPQTTGQTVPLRAVTFVDDSHGWAVGELGSILATQDGGRTWQPQRAGGNRAALLAFFAHSDDVPLELVADQAGAEGYLTAVKLMHYPSAGGPNVPVAAARSDARVRDAMLLAGATAAETAWRFPLPPDDLAFGPAELLDALNRANDGRAMEELERQLVRDLRTWRPEVVVTHHSRLEMSRPIAGLVEQLVLRSIDSAGDPTQFVELAADAGLAPWSVKRAFGVLPPGSRGDEVISTGRFSARLGSSLADRSAPARHLLATALQISPPPDSIELELLVNRTSTSDGPRGLFSGIALSPGGGARRPTANDIAGDVDTLRRLAAQRRNLRQLLERSEGNAAWMAQIERLIEGLPADSGGELLFQLAAGYRDTGRLDLAADTYFLLARRYPDHPLVDQSLVWLVQFYASGEGARRSSEQQPFEMQPADAMASSENGDGVKPASAAAPIDENFERPAGLSRDDRLRRAVQLGDYLESSRPLVYADPSLRFPLVAAQRQLGFANPARRYFLTVGKLPANDPWRECAEAEEWLSKPGDSPPPKPLGHCRIALERPHLDGRLDEPLWERADRLRLKGDAAGAAEVRLTYDKEYLYIGVRCLPATGGEFRSEDGPRPRDADLSAHDRVSLRFDADRDFTTSFELIVDRRGWTRESCCGDASWNPTWFVAASNEPLQEKDRVEAKSKAAWTVEAAIPLGELVGEVPTSRDVWAAAIRRTIPRVGYQAWSGAPESDESPDSFGLLIFE